MTCLLLLICSTPVDTPNIEVATALSRESTWTLTRFGHHLQPLQAYLFANLDQVFAEQNRDKPEIFKLTAFFCTVMHHLERQEEWSDHVTYLSESSHYNEQGHDRKRSRWIGKAQRFK